MIQHYTYRNLASDKNFSQFNPAHILGTDFPKNLILL
jgi:hypothetical protein